METRQITKVEAAATQLSYAIELYFNESDIIPIHTLAAASKGILSDLVENTEFERLDLEKVILSKFKPDAHRIIRAAIREPQNFFKHADKDRDKILELKSGHTEFIIYSSLTLLQMLGYKDIRCHINLFAYAIWHIKTTTYLTYHLDENSWEILFNLLVVISHNIRRLHYSCTRKEFYLWFMNEFIKEITASIISGFIQKIFDVILSSDDEIGTQLKELFEQYTAAHK